MTLHKQFWQIISDNDITKVEFEVVGYSWVITGWRTVYKYPWKAERRIRVFQCSGEMNLATAMAALVDGNTDNIMNGIVEDLPIVRPLTFR